MGPQDRRNRQARMARPARLPRKLGIGLAIVVALGGAATPRAGAQVWQPGNRLALYPSGDQLGARWGATMVAGDFDDDGYDDLAAGAPERDVMAGGGTLIDGGAAEVWLGGPSGLDPNSSLRLNGLFNDARLATALATGDFDGDGRDELALSSPGADSAGVDHSGEVRVWSRPVDAWLLDSIWRQGDGLPGDNMPFDQIGQALAVGDFDRDGYDDLVIGVPGENVTPPGGSEILDAGSILIVHGSADGLTASGVQLLHESSPGLEGAQANARFGFALAAGHFNEDTYDDLAIGIPFRDAPGAQDSGQIVVLFGGPAGLTTAGFQRFDDADFAGGAVAAGDQFGYALAVGQFRSTGACPVDECYDSLAIGIPGEPVGGAASAGGFLEVRASSSGISPATAIFWSQDGLGAATNNAEAGDRFGSVLVAGRLDGRDGDDLVAGVPVEDWAGDVDQGMIHLLFGGPSGLIVTYPGQWRIQDGFASGPGHADDQFGAALAIGDFNGDGTGDLAAGAPGRTMGGLGDAGAVQLFRGAVFADGFEGGSTAIWSSSLP